MPDLEKFKTLMQNIDDHKANRCYTGGSNGISDLYTDLINGTDLTNVEFTFGGNVAPPSGGNVLYFGNISTESAILVMDDLIYYMYYGDQITIYSAGNWASELTYTFPPDFIIDTIMGNYNEYEDVLRDIKTIHNSRQEITICDLNEKVNESINEINSKASRCIIPGNSSDLYTDIINGTNLSNTVFTFSTDIIPAGNMYLFQDMNTATGIIFMPDQIDYYLNATAINIYNGTSGWNDTLTYTFPEDFTIDYAQGDINQWIPLLQSIVTGIPGSEETICSLKDKLETKANNCVIPETEINFYNAIHNNQSLGGSPFRFNGYIGPINDEDLVITDSVKGISLIAHNGGFDDPIAPFIKITGLEPDPIIIYDDTGYVTRTVEFPPDFNYDIVSGLEKQQDLCRNILLTIPERIETICSLTNKIYGGNDTNFDFTDLWLREGGNDQNDGYTKDTAVESLDKILSILEEKSNGERQITVHMSEGNYTIGNITATSIKNVQFIQDPITTGPPAIFIDDKPLKFKDSSDLSFKDIWFAQMTDNYDEGAIVLGLNNCKNIEFYQCAFMTIGTGFINIGLLGLNKSDCTILDCVFSYQTEVPTDIVAAVMMNNNSYLSWNSWSAVQVGLEHLIINPDSTAFLPEKVYGTDVVPTAPKNTIGYYNQSIISSDNTVDDIVFGEKPSVAESQAHPQKIFFYED